MTARPPRSQAFWEGLDGVANALANVPARLYVDRKLCGELELAPEIYRRTVEQQEALQQLSSISSVFSISRVKP